MKGHSYDLRGVPFHGAAVDAFRQIEDHVVDLALRKHPPRESLIVDRDGNSHDTRAARRTRIQRAAVRHALTALMLRVEREWLLADNRRDVWRDALTFPRRGGDASGYIDAEIDGFVMASIAERVAHLPNSRERHRHGKPELLIFQLALIRVGLSKTPVPQLVESLLVDFKPLQEVVECNLEAPLSLPSPSA